MVAPKVRSSKELKIVLATSTSWIGSPVRDTRIVSPIPSANRVPIPIADLMVPCLIVPASVTPRCNGYRILLDNLRYASIIKGTSVALIETFI